MSWAGKFLGVRLHPNLLHHCQQGINSILPGTFACSEVYGGDNGLVAYHRSGKRINALKGLVLSLCVVIFRAIVSIFIKEGIALPCRYAHQLPYPATLWVRT